MTKLEQLRVFLSGYRVVFCLLRISCVIGACATVLTPAQDVSAEMNKRASHQEVTLLSAPKSKPNRSQEIVISNERPGYFAIKLTKVKIKQLLPGALKKMRALGAKCHSRKKADIKKFQGLNGACDNDGDKIPNFLEKRIGTNYRLKDTDSDGLTDREELLKYNTDPLVADTDGDGLIDGDEINRTHTDPLNPDTDGNGIDDGIQFPIPTPTPTPPIGHAGQCTANNFDSSGNTNQFLIPSPLIGNSGRGQSIYQTQSCFRCHGVTERGTNLTYPQLSAALSGPLMGASLAALGLTPSSQATADLVAWLNRAQTAREIVCPATATPSPTPFPTIVVTPTRTPTSSPTRTPTGTATPIPSGTPCPGGNFDISGNTTQFSIPSPLVGNVGRGGAVYTQQICYQCHASLEKGTSFSYTQLQASLTGPSMGASLTALGLMPTSQQTADLVAYLNRSNAGGNCATPTFSPSPTPSVSATPTASRTPTPSPSPTGTPCAGGNFDGSGNTTAFGIPSPIIGNVNSGSSQYTTTCVSCHNLAFGERGGGYTFTQLKSAFMTNPGMTGRVSLTDQQIANVIAFVNRANTGGCSSPTPTPTPISPIARGAQIFGSSCGLSGCHALNGQGTPTRMDRHPSKNKIHEALWSGPDSMPQFRYLTAGQTAPPYTAEEDALYQYLLSLP